MASRLLMSTPAGKLQVANEASNNWMFRSSYGSARGVFSEYELLLPEIHNRLTVW